MLIPEAGVMYPNFWHSGELSETGLSGLLSNCEWRHLQSHPTDVNRAEAEF